MVDNHERDATDGGLDEIFLAALELSPEARRAFLDRVCAEADDLRAEVEALLEIATESPGLVDPPDIGLVPARLGRYEIVAERGRGGMGIVFEARDTELLRTVALKVLPRYLSQHERGRERFKREARFLAGLQHPNIATLHSLEDCDGIQFLTMEFIDGTTLAEILQHRRLTVVEAISMARQMAAGLEAAHEQGICHCDLKPANIMITDTWRVALLDFGVARAYGQTAGGEHPVPLVGAPSTLGAGTPGYMAPEQVRGEAADHRTDLWALGVIVYESLTGSAWPADGSRRPWWTELPLGTPSGLVEVLRGCLEPAPERRIASAGAVRDRLERLERRRVPGRRRLAAGLLVAVIVAGLALVFARSPRGPIVDVAATTSHTLSAVNARGSVVWARDFALEIRGAALIRDPVTEQGILPPARLCAVALWRRGENGVVAMLDPQTGLERWRHAPRWQQPVNAGGPFLYRWFGSCAFPGRDEPVLLAAVRDGIWYAMGIEAIGAEGELLGVYHHPGPLTLDPSIGPGSNSIIMVGTNSSARFDRRLVPFETEHHPGCLVWLDADTLSGQAYPYGRSLPEPRDWQGLPPARERAYLLVPMLHPGSGARIRRFQLHDEGSSMGYGHAATEDGRVIILDESFRPLRATITLHSFADSVYQRGIAENPPFLLLRDGVEEWIDVPLGY